MKITKSQLQRVIKEEIAKALREDASLEGKRVKLPRSIAPNGSGKVIRANDDGTLEVEVTVKGGKKYVTVDASEIENSQGD